MFGPSCGCLAPRDKINTNGTANRNSLGQTRGWADISLGLRRQAVPCFDSRAGNRGSISNCAQAFDVDPSFVFARDVPLDRNVNDCAHATGPARSAMP